MDMERPFSILMVFLVIHGTLAVLPQMQHVLSKFEFRYSFKGPYMVNAKGQIPFWNLGGSAIPSDDQVRVCPSIKSRRGWVWTKEKFLHRNWMVDVTLRVTGRLKNGADGMAIWFTEEPGTEGPVFGNIEMWKGMGVILDSFDNDALHDNPKIQVTFNDGTVLYEHASDGLRQEAGSCLREFRNRPHPVRLRITYLRGVLEVWVHDGMSLIDDDYELCTRIETDKVPAEGYFGVTAATGGLSDDHDVLHFITHSLTPFEDRKEELLKMVDNEQAQKVADEYLQRAQEFDKRKEQYYHDHPQARQATDDWQVELELEQNVRHVAEMQAQLQIGIQKLSTKLDTLLMGGKGDGVVNRDTSTLVQDISEIRTTESNILHQLADLRSAIDRSVPQGAPAAASEQLQPVYETKTMVQQNTEQLKAIEKHLKLQEVPPGHQCPPPSDTPSCVSPLFFSITIVLQVAVVVGYMLYRQTQEQNAKKFF